MKHILFLLLLSIFLSCSHDYESNDLDLGFYQWNFWTDDEAKHAGPSLSDQQLAHGGVVVHPPSCGWEELHRGNGKLVRIPAIAGTHFTPDYIGVVWFHTRFTLPELWADTDISMSFEGVSGSAEIYLNEQLVGSHIQSEASFSLNLTGNIYYTRDNHLAIRITNSNPGDAGITGKITLKSSATGDQTPGSATS